MGGGSKNFLGLPAPSRMGSIKFAVRMGDNATRQPQHSLTSGIPPDSTLAGARAFNSVHASSRSPLQRSLLAAPAADVVNPPGQAWQSGAMTDALRCRWRSKCRWRRRIRGAPGTPGARQARRWGVGWYRATSTCDIA